jgi:dolichol kinase
MARDMISDVEIRRKVVHLSSLAIPIGYALTSKGTALTVLIPLSLGFLSVEFLRRYHPGVGSLFRKLFIGRVLREQEIHTLMGSTYFLLSSVLVIAFFPKSIAIVSVLILTISDTCAAWVGRAIGRIRIYGKTLEGSLGFLLSALLIVWIYPGLDRLSGSLAALGATVVELLPIPVDDNLTIPFTAAALMLFAGT